MWSRRQILLRLIRSWAPRPATASTQLYHSRTADLAGLIRALSPWLLIIVLVTTAAGCATGPVPGGGTYGITITTKQNTLMVGKGNEFTYGRHSRTFALNGGGGTGGISGFAEFHVLRLNWTTAAGVERHEIIDIAPLIERMQAKHKINPFDGLRTLRVEINGKRLTISYEIIPHQGYVAKKGARRKHLLYESKHNWAGRYCMEIIANANDITLSDPQQTRIINRITELKDLLQSQQYTSGFDQSNGRFSPRSCGSRRGDHRKTTGGAVVHSRALKSSLPAHATADACPMSPPFGIHFGTPTRVYFANRLCIASPYRSEQGSCSRRLGGHGLT